jgi:hypothetical protein
MLIKKVKSIVKGLRKKGEHIEEVPPTRAVILLSSPRSGSTWLFDAIRCHPAIYVHPSAVIYERLGMKGRRYPRDLSNGPHSVQEIEVKRQHWERIPMFDVSDMMEKTPERFLCETYAIEKCHPEFFNYDASVFLDNVRRLEEKSVQLKFVYQVREPRASIASFMSYQKRNLTWYPKTKDARLATYMCQTYETILEVARQRRGHIIDYADLATTLESVLKDIYSYLWPNPNTSEANFMLQVSPASVKATSRDRRVSTGSPFLGEAAGPISGASPEHSHFFDRYDKEIAKCYSSYEFLLNSVQNVQEF